MAKFASVRRDHCYSSKQTMEIDHKEVGNLCNEEAYLTPSELLKE